MKFVFTIANNVGPDEMPPFVAFHLGLHCFSQSSPLGLFSIQRLIMFPVLQRINNELTYMSYIANKWDTERYLYKKK